MKRKPLTELEAVAMRDAKANADTFFRLQHETDAARADFLRMMSKLHNHGWLPTDDCPRCAIEARLVAWAKGEGVYAHAANSSQDAAVSQQENR
jgi:hypothetical protein